MSTLPPAEIEYELLHASDNRAPNLLAAYITCLVISYIAVLLRFISRRQSRNAWLADDWMVVVGLIFTTAQIGVGFEEVHLGAGKHIIFMKNPALYVKGIILMEVFYTTAAALIKFSTLLLYRRIFGSNQGLRIACWVVAAFVSCYSIAQIFESIFQCTPVRKAWEPEVPGTCLNVFVAATTPAVFNVVADFATVCLPMPLIWGLQMRWGQKIQVLGIFLLSGFVIIASIFRAVTVKELSHVDASWSNVDPYLWTTAENGVAIVSTCLPTLRPLFSLLTRGHYCNSRAYCSRCQDRSTNATKGKSWRLWASFSSGGRQGSDQTHLPETAVLEKKLSDVEDQRISKEQDVHPYEVFSIVDQRV